MPLVAMHTALSELEDHLEALATFAVQAWDRYHSLPAADRMIFGARERANCVHAYMVHYAAEYVAVAPGTIRCFKLNQMCGIVIDNKYAIRFKKLEDLALDVIGEAFKRVPAKKYIEHMEAAVKSRKGRPSKGTSKAAKSPQVKAAKGRSSVGKSGKRK